MRKLVLSVALAAGILLVAWMWGLNEVVRTHQARAQVGGTVLFIVLDTVRGDHLSGCGYDRPTSPNLDALATRGTLVCDAVAPGSWTFPSHASFFTGAWPWEHHAHFAEAGADVRKAIIQPLGEELPTLAEQLGEQGYQAHGLSGNPMLQEATGLSRGFETWGTPKHFGPWYGTSLVRKLKRLLRTEVRTDQPLFLFLNIADAHDPWDGVPAGVEWLPEDEELLAYFRLEDDAIVPDDPWTLFVTGRHPDPEGLKRRVTNLYDHAVWEADQTLGESLKVLEDHGWLAEDTRVIVVSDHGEYLGEHGLLRHGRYLYEPNQRVPLLTIPAMEFVSPTSAMEAYHVALTGRPAGLPALAGAWPDSVWAQQSENRLGVHTSAATWTSEDKTLWQDGESWTTDFADARTGPAEPPQHAREVRMSGVGASGSDPGMLEALKAAGYMD